MCGIVGFSAARHDREQAKKTIKEMADLRWRWATAAFPLLT